MVQLPGRSTEHFEVLQNGRLPQAVVSLLPLVAFFAD
jgi:hypothetical protein